MSEIFSLLGLMLCLSLSSHAQPVFNFSANPVDSFTTGHNWDTTETIRSYIRNTTTGRLVLNWQLITDSTDRPPGWLMAGICDNWFCRTPLEDSLEVGHKVQHTEAIAPGDPPILKLRAFVVAKYARWGWGYLSLKFTMPRKPRSTRSFSDYVKT